MGASFDGIYTGFVASEEQIRQIFRFLDTFHSRKSFLLVDPVMGDDGIPYDMFSDALLSLMKELVFQADIITPNVTELCLLTGACYQKIINITDTSSLLKNPSSRTVFMRPDKDIHSQTKTCHRNRHSVY